MSLISMINEIRVRRDTRELWDSLTKEQKYLTVEGLTGNEDHKTLFRRLRKISNKAKHAAAEKRKHELNRRLQEIQAFVPADPVLLELRRQVLEINRDEPNPMLRSAKLWQTIRKYDAEWTLLNTKPRVVTVYSRTA
jgi:hypothetical protein